MPVKSAKPKPKTSKTSTLLKLLRSNKGASMAQLQHASGWQAHSVRGFLAGTVKRRLGLTVLSRISQTGERLYSIGSN
ncbi:MAG: DUF3489 domain-containing protein [Alphaproteobacteria bacterium]|nr:DUF3489 domain-containing protein [Alphaproteobacteria bacterium]